MSGMEFAWMVTYGSRSQIHAHRTSFTCKLVSQPASKQADCMSKYSSRVTCSLLSFIEALREVTGELQLISFCHLIDLHVPLLILKSKNMLFFFPFFR